MRRISLAGAAAVTVAALIAAGASGQTETKFSVITLTQSSHESGEGVVVHGKVVDPRDRSHVLGHDRARFTPDGRRIQARVRFHFADGSVLKVEGAFGPGDNKLAIAGGSGRWEDAEGRALLHDAGEGAERYTFEITGP